MHEKLVEILKCPRTDEPLELSVVSYSGDRIETGVLTAKSSGYTYPIRNFIPRFVPESNYANSFGLQWNRFRKTQLDSYSGVPVSGERFWQTTGLAPDELAGKRVLDCGCGAGRFAEIALQAGAEVVAIDYSSAADACFQNLGDNPRLDVVQADIYSLPFLAGRFDYVYSLGVLQHTPDVHQAFASLPPMVKPGGSLFVDYYEMTLRHRLLPRHYIRLLTRYMNNDSLFKACSTIVPLLLPISKAIGRVPYLGKTLVRAMPVADYSQTLPLSSEQLEEWAVLDTFDWLSPRYDQPQHRGVVQQWAESSGFRDVDVFKSGFLIVRAAHKL